MYPTFDWSVAPGHHGYQRACDLISGKASRRPNGSPVLARAGKTEPPSRLVLSQTSAGNSQFIMQTKRLIRILIERNIIPRTEMSLERIGEWMRANVRRAQRRCDAKTDRLCFSGSLGCPMTARPSAPRA